MQVHSHQPADQVNHIWPLAREGGTSGLFAAVIGILMGYDQIILAGVPCDNTPHFFDPPWLETQTHMFGLESCYNEWKAWRNEVPIFKDKVRSLSGNTRDLLGASE